jgi:hypothetical protein
VSRALRPRTRLPATTTATSTSPADQRTTAAPCSTNARAAAASAASHPTRNKPRAALSPAAETTIITDFPGEDYGYYDSPPPSATSSSLFTNPLARTPRGMEDVVMEVRERASLLMDDGDDINSVSATTVNEAIA